ncbi:MAG: isoprenyl transferase [Desulfosarcina sp.]|nr:isoprenyl transferase [Desulfobacterales bacterium]
MGSRISSIDATELGSEYIPKHVAIIMDGNGRWAKKRLLNRIKGHEKGADTVRAIVKTCRKIGIPILTLFAFSTENWQRPKVEVAALMSILKRFLLKEQKEMVENDIRLNAIGQIERLSEDVRNALRNAMELTKNNKGLLLNLAISYGGRDEIVRAVQKIAGKVKNGIIDPGAMQDQITEDLISDNLYTRAMPDPDLLIRTSGEMRISNFLLWQIAYAEIFITDTLWPDFGSKEFISILKDYQGRERRFGKV